MTIRTKESCNFKLIWIHLSNVLSLPASWVGPDGARSDEGPSTSEV